MIQNLSQNHVLVESEINNLPGAKPNSRLEQGFKI